MEKLKEYANHRAVLVLYLIIISVLFHGAYDRIFDKKVHLGGTSENGKDNYNLKYKDISEEKFEDIVTEVENFIELIFNLNKDFNFTNNFGISIPLIKKSKTILKKDLMQYLKTGFALKEKELSVDKDLAIEESLFFYPLVGALNKLAYEITKSK